MLKTHSGEIEDKVKVHFKFQGGNDLCRTNNQRKNRIGSKKPFFREIFMHHL